MQKLKKNNMQKKRIFICVKCGALTQEIDNEFFSVKRINVEWSKSILGIKNCKEQCVKIKKKSKKRYRNTKLYLDNKYLNGLKRNNNKEIIKL